MDTNLNDVPMIRYDDMSTFEDEIWNNEEIETGVSKSGLMGTKLDLPPVRQRMGGKPSKLTIIQPPSRPVSRAQGGVTPTPGPEVPGLGHHLHLTSNLTKRRGKYIKRLTNLLLYLI